jgi:glycine/D-amino acid oxidase-like deaminating enzyme
MAQTYDVVVVGAGISGASTAYYLQASGAGRVLLIERGIPASGGTGKSAAIVRQHYSTPLMARLAKQSIGIFAAMPSELGSSGGFVNCGYHLLLSPQMRDAALANAAMQRAVGVRTQSLDPSEWAQSLPWLNPEGVAGVLYEPDGGYADPVASTEAYVAAFERAGGTIRSKTSCRALIRKNDRITGVVLDDGEIAAGTIVNAAGPWAKPLADSAGLEVQMRSVREQDTVWEARDGRALPQGSVSNAVDAIYLRPLGDRRYIIGRGFPKEYFDVDPYNYKASADDDFIADVDSRLELHIPGFAGSRLIASYAALYDVTVDWYPYVGPRSGLQGYVDFCGGSGHGFKIAPAIAMELAKWILAGTAADDFRQLSYDRIARSELFAGSYGGNRG